MCIHAPESILSSVLRLPALPYAYDALEPHIDARTMEIHHTKHHQAYVDKLNKALEGTELVEPRAFANAATEQGIEEVLKNLGKLPADKQKPVRNNGGGHFNHSLFWTVMAPRAGGKPSGELLKAIESAFVSFEDFQKKFEEAAVNQFGSGWAWLVVESGKLKVDSSANQDSPIMRSVVPIFGIDVWEHAYYLKYQNKRPDYVKAFWNVVNWAEVERRYISVSREPGQGQG
ncbi:superoxide dismutase [Candidatus Peregrinibacteria bacterium]|nr:superoxide dismutase [Candidatus Peregrinibacteria bacterium]